MSTQLGVLDITFKAAGDYRLKQYFLMKVSTAETATIGAGDTEKVIGVLQNKPQTGEAAVIRVIGLTKIKCGIAAIGSLIVSNSDGVGTPMTTGTPWVIGILTEPSNTNGDIVEMLITQHQANR